MTSLTPNQFTLPPRVENAEGELRRVGFEIEFSGITMDEAVSALLGKQGVSVLSQTIAETTLEVEPLGEFRVEIDWAYLKHKAAEEGDDKSDREWLELLSQAASLLVPVEVVGPPVRMDQLDQLNPIIEALRKAGAVGTEESLLAAYGVHINTEIPSLEAGTLFDYLRAYSILQWWLVDNFDIDATRRLTPYIDLFPEAYLFRVLSQRSCDMDTIFDDYFEFNATRNRSLDMLPMLAEIDESRVRRAVDDPRIQARPAFHYRLPDCHIEKEDWSLAEAWDSWLMVEKLAERTDDLDELGNRFCKSQRPIIGVNRSDWVQTIDQWLVDRGLA